MSGIVIAAGLAVLLGFPVVASVVMWCLSGRGGTERPEPPRTNRIRRNIPGRDSRD